MTDDSPDRTDDSNEAEPTGSGVSGSDATDDSADADVAAPTGPAGLRATYDRIAGHFAETRHHPWPEVTAFLDDRTARVGVDLGCGNGRHAEPLAERTDRVIGVDVSRALLGEARERAVERGYADRLSLVAGDAASVPLASDAVGLGVYVATLHHLRPRARRVASLSELGRVLEPGGRALVGVWSTAHDRFDRETGFDTTVPWTLPGGETVPRYYHVYDPAEFRADLDRAAVRTLRHEVSSGNCYTVIAPE